MMGTWDVTSRGSSGELWGGDTGGDWQGIQSSRGQGNKQPCERRAQGSEMGQHMPYKKADTQTEQKRC